MLAKHRTCCPGDGNPWTVQQVCPKCGDTERVAAAPACRQDDIRTCPHCGTPERRAELWRERRRAISPHPDISTVDLTAAEAAMVADWRASGYHELDCLRWIEGQQYDPEEDAAFLRQVREALAAWREVSGRAGVTEGLAAGDRKALPPAREHEPGPDEPVPF